MREMIVIIGGFCAAIRCRDSAHIEFVPPASRCVEFIYLAQGCAKKLREGLGCIK